MKYVGTPETSELTGLSVETLREWTVRRALIPADLPPRAKGSPARYSWQTVLILRLAVSLKNRFHIELQAHKPLFAQLKEEMQHLEPADLGGKALLLLGEGGWTLADDAVSARADVLVIHLKSYLDSLSEFFGFADAASQQFSLFPTDNPSTERKEPRGTPVAAVSQEVVA
jgi:hypothetical protein